MIVTVDGDPGENPRYDKTIKCSIKYLAENGLDAFYLATNATCGSRYDQITNVLSLWLTPFVP